VRKRALVRAATAAADSVASMPGRPRHVPDACDHTTESVAQAECRPSRYALVSRRKDNGIVADFVAESFEDWFAELAAAAEDPTDMEGRTLAAMRPGYRAILEELYAARGPLTNDELSAALGADVARLDALRLQTCIDLLPRVLSDAAVYGQTGLQVTFDPIEGSSYGGLLMEVRHADWSAARYYGDNEPDGYGPDMGWNADTLTWLATGIQEACLLGPLPNPPHYWPLCEHHGVGVHPRVNMSVAVWWCTSGGGHVVAPIGELPTRPSSERQRPRPVRP
jgi:hypothetical protein